MTITIDELPGEVLLRIFSYLSPSDICKCRAVCSSWTSIASDNVLWRVKYAEQPWCVQNDLSQRKVPDCDYDAELLESGYLQFKSRRLWEDSVDRSFVTGAYAHYSHVGHRDVVLSVVCHPTLPLVYSGARDGSLFAWDRNTGELTAEYQGHRGGISSLAICGRGCCVLSGGWDATLRAWPASAAAPVQGQGKIPHILSVGTGLSAVICLWAGLGLVVCGVHSGDVYMWHSDCAGLKLFRRLPGDQPCFAIDAVLGVTPMCTLAIGRGKHVESSEIDVDEGSIRRHLQYNHMGDVNALCITAGAGPGSGHILSGGEDGAIMADGEGMAQLDVGVRCMAVRGEVLAAGAYDGMVRVYHITTKVLLYTLAWHRGDVNTVVLGNTWCASGGDDCTVQLMDYRPRVVVETMSPGARDGWLKWALVVLAQARGRKLRCREVFAGIVAIHGDVAKRGKTPANTLSALLHRESRRGNADALVGSVKAMGGTRFYITDKGRAALSAK